MTGLIRFPPRRSTAILVCAERGGDGWLAIAGARGWLFGSLAEALREARWLSRNLDFPIRGEVGLEGVPR
jgi:hypothetical protein